MEGKDITTRQYIARMMMRANHAPRLRKRIDAIAVEAVDLIALLVTNGSKVEFPEGELEIENPYDHRKDVCVKSLRVSQGGTLYMTLHEDNPKEVCVLNVCNTEGCVKLLDKLVGIYAK